VEEREPAHDSGGLKDRTEVKIGNAADGRRLAQ
jgi:hypothetical protein